jgi:hypothetical protein
MSEIYTYVYQACQIVIQQETEQRWTYVVISNEEYYEPHPAKAFDSEEGALKAEPPFAIIEWTTLARLMAFTGGQR